MGPKRPNHSSPSHAKLGVSRALGALGLACIASACGIGTLESSGSSTEGATTSDDGGTALAVCGNGTREQGEQCDDGNTVNLDGCGATCQLEQLQRVDSLQIQWGTDPTCAANALGASIGSQAQSQFQQTVSSGVASGAISMLLQFIGLADLTGASNGPVTLGALTGSPATASGYDGTKDLDGWYSIAASTLDAQRNPSATLAGSMASGALTAGPGSMTVSLTLGGAPSPLHLSNVMLAASVGAASTPTVSQGATPGHLASENLDPTLTSFATMSGGTLCGNISAASLATVPVPAQLAQGGADACSQGYTSANSMLDVLVGGCSVFFFTVISATQPDQVAPAAPAAGAGGPYSLSIGSNSAVSGCTDSAGASVDVPTCLAAAAYSAYFQFATDRVIGKP
jgi:cysteine-rich repeat protein